MMEMKNLDASDLVTISVKLSMHVKLFECLFCWCVHFNRAMPWQKINVANSVFVLLIV